MFKLFYKIQEKIKGVDERTQAVLAKRASEPYSSSLLNLNIIGLALLLFMYETASLVVKYFIIIAFDPGESFNVFFKQRELRSCPYSYHYYKTVRYKARFFSVTTATAIVLVSVVTTLITNLLFGGGNMGQAETFGWTQTSWNRASTTAVANHNSDQTTWNYFHSKDASVSTSSGVRLGTASSGWLQTSDTDFNANTTTTGVYVNSGSIKLLKPDGATCAVNSDCLSNWCDGAVCKNMWLSGPCAGLLVYYVNSANAQWNTSGAVCGATECQTGLDTTYPTYMTLKFSNTIDFSAHPARNACKTLGGRLPTMTELSCMHTNRASYRDNFTGWHWSATESGPSGSSLGIMFPGGSIGGLTKNGTYGVRCVK